MNLLAFLGLAIAQAAEPTEQVALACEGTAGDRAIKPFGIIVNFTDRTIKDLGSPGDEIKLTYVNEMSIGFNSTIGGSWTFSGGIDRVTGELQATETQKLSMSETLTNHISLKCKPTQRMF